MYIDTISDYTWHNNSRTWHWRCRNRPFTLCKMKFQVKRSGKFLCKTPPSSYSGVTELWRLVHSEWCCPQYVQTGMSCQWLSEQQRSLASNHAWNCWQCHATQNEKHLCLFAGICQCYRPFATLRRISRHTVWRLYTSRCTHGKSIFRRSYWYPLCSPLAWLHSKQF